MTKTQIIIAATVSLTIVVGAIIRAKRISPISWNLYGKVYQDSGIAIHGMDSLSYHQGAPVPGSEEFSAQWRGARWLFASGKNRDAFTKDPERWAPAFGGFCSYASSKGFTANCDGKAYEVKDGRLYLFNDDAMRRNWLGVLGEGAIEKARAHWTRQAEKSE